jgi:hypothetical protein
VYPIGSNDALVSSAIHLLVSDRHSSLHARLDIHKQQRLLATSTNSAGELLVINEGKLKYFEMR